MLICKRERDSEVRHPSSHKSKMEQVEGKYALGQPLAAKSTSGVPQPRFLALPAGKLEPFSLL